METTPIDQQSQLFMEKRTFQDRRKKSRVSSDGQERRQFGNSYKELSEEGQDLGMAIDRYKMEKKRRFINFDEILLVIHQLGYQKVAE